jgi:hypothetical protein
MENADLIGFNGISWDLLGFIGLSDGIPSGKPT